VTHPQQQFFISTKTFKSTAFVKTAVALAAVIWALKRNEMPTTVTLPQGQVQFFMLLCQAKVLPCIEMYCAQLYVTWFYIKLHQGHCLFAC
jgi:hypothetical protein